MRNTLKALVIAALAGTLLVPGIALADDPEMPAAGEPIIEAAAPEEAVEDEALEPDILTSPAPEPAADPEPTPEPEPAPEPEPEPEPAHEDGWETTDEGTFYWLDGAKATGWLELDGNRFYLDPADGHLYANGIYEIDGAKYYFRGEGNAWGPEGSMGSGWVRGYGDPAKDYYFDRSTGQLVESGWFTDRGTRYYVDSATGEVLSGGIYEIDGAKYFFRPAGSPWGPEGSMGSGWVEDAGQTYFFDRATGAMIPSGIQEVDGATYFFRPAGSPWGPEGSMGTGWVNGYGDPAADYYFDRTTGKMITDKIVKIGSKLYYFGIDGTVQKGWFEKAGSKFYADSTDGHLYTDGVYEIDGDSYYFRPAGSSWGPEGSRGAGWVEDGGNTFFFSRSSGKMLKDGIHEIDGAKYYIRGKDNPWGPEGSMGKGWVRNYGDPADDYFFDRTTLKLVESGWLKDFDTWYYIDPATGEYLPEGIHDIDGKSYYFRGEGNPWGPAGSMGRGWVTIGSTNYFFDRNDGHMYKNDFYIIDGVPYKADADGKMTRQPTRYPAMLAKAQGYSSSTNYLILIDAGDNVICVYQGYYGNWVPVKESRCSTGAPATYTPSGIYRSGAQGYSFSGDGHTCYYYTQIYGDVLIHSILYHEGTFNVMDGRLGYHISGGCVRCPLDFAKWVYDNIPYYTTIVVYR